LAASTTLPADVASRPKVPSPLPALAATVQLVPLPETFVMTGDPPSAPPGTAVNAEAPTPVTSSLNVTVHETVEALVGLVAARTMDSTVGGVMSDAAVTASLSVLAAVHDRKTEVTV